MKYIGINKDIISFYKIVESKVKRDIEKLTNKLRHSLFKR